MENSLQKMPCFESSTVYYLTPTIGTVPQEVKSVFINMRIPRWPLGAFAAWRKCVLQLAVRIIAGDDARACGLTRFR
jgi:hypothetical protein